MEYLKLPLYGVYELVFINPRIGIYEMNWYLFLFFNLFVLRNHVH